jgi:sigma-B regulation protein RsbU (phosphoserine phosphatase)
MEIEDYIVKTESINVIKAKISSVLKTKSKQRSNVINEIQKAVNSTGAKVIPSETPKIEGLEIHQWHETYEGIPGGDFIDYVNLKDKYTAVILGDVMGKKWGAWNFAFAYAGYIRSAARMVLQSSSEITASKLLDEINKAIFEDEKVSEVFITLSLVLIDRDTGKIQYSGAGDLPLIYKNFDKNSVDSIDSDGLLLGFSDDSHYEDIELELNHNDVILIFTDGILESRDTGGDQFGMERLKQNLAEIDSSKSEYFERIKKSF